MLLFVPRTALALSAEAFIVSAPSVCYSLSHNCRFAELFSTFSLCNLTRDSAINTVALELFYIFCIVDNDHK